MDLKINKKIVSTRFQAFLNIGTNLTIFLIETISPEDEHTYIAIVIPLRMGLGVAKNTSSFLALFSLSQDGEK